MLRLFFNRFSPLVFIVEIIGVVFIFLTMRLFFSFPHIGRLLLILYTLEYLSLRLFALIRWHPQSKRYEGIELHFKKLMVAVAYLLALLSILLYITHNIFFAILGIILFGMMLYPNLMLVYLYTKDKNTTPINHFSGNKYLPNIPNT